MGKALHKINMRGQNEKEEEEDDDDDMEKARKMF